MCLEAISNLHPTDHKQPLFYYFGFRASNQEISAKVLETLTSAQPNEILSVLKENKNAIWFYEQQDFVHDGTARINP
jgi:hypothetical protein